MTTLLDVLPNPEDLLALSPEDLGGLLIEFIPGLCQQAGFTLDNVMAQLSPPNGSGYPKGTVWEQTALAIGEAMSWLTAEGLLMRNPMQSHPWYLLTRRGANLRTRADVEAYMKGRALPRELVQPYLAEKVLHLFLRGDYDTAVFQAFKEVEVSVRKLGDFGDKMFGTALMAEAFHVDRGKLTDMNLVPAEREATRNLFTGAIGHAKNPASHRDVRLDREQAARLIIFASYLLDMLERWVLN